MIPAKMTYADSLRDPKAAARLIRAAARAGGHEAMLEDMLALIPSAAVARRLAERSRSDTIRQVAIVYLAERPDPQAN